MAAKSTLEIIINGTDNFSKDFARSLDNVGKKLQGIGTALTVSVTAPLVAMGVKAVSAASDLAEAQNAVNVVFGDSAKIIQDYAKDSAKAIGMSAAEFSQASAVMGAFLKNVGFDSATAAEETINLGKRAADMASIFNTDVSTALAAIQSGLKGEFNPLEQFGVKLNAAAIEAKALEMGLADQAGQLDDTAKAQAALALIYEQTNVLAGDFANTSDGLANSQKILGAQFQDAAASIGQLLIPVALQLVGILSNVLNWVLQLTPAQQQLILVIAGVAAAIGPLLVVLGTLMRAFSSIQLFLSGPMIATLGSLLLPIALIVAAVIALALAWKNNWFDIRGKTQAAIEWIRAAVDKFLDALTQFWNSHKTEIIVMVNTMWTFLKTLFQTASQLITQVVTAALGVIQAFWDAHGATVMAIVQSLWSFIQSTFSAAISIITSIFKAFTAALQGDWTAFGEYLRSAWDTLWKWIKDTVKSAWDAIKTIDWASLGKSIISGIANGITSAASIIKDAALKAAKAAFEAVKAFFGIESPSKLMAGVGANMMQGMALGITGNASAPAMASVRAAQAVTSQTVNNFTLNMTSNAPVSTLAHDFGLMQSMVSAR